tara:strand:- start:887 stop:1699 length:813 start_codon:yes stop_codon:yes gene_type:complete
MFNKYKNIRINKNNPATNFTYDHYKKIIKEMKKTHEILNFKNVYELKFKNLMKINKFLIMRHDIELNLDRALKLAEIENEFNISSTYFLLPSSDYNIFEEIEINKIREIIKLGHDIGLHYDLELISKYSNNPKKIVMQIIKILEEFYKIKIHAISSHMPMRSKKILQLPNIINTYDPKYFQQIKYLSDSNQAWREGDIISNIRKYDKIHLLMHENCWSENGLHFGMIILNDVFEKFETKWKQNMQLYRQMEDGIKQREKKDRDFKNLFIK